MTKDQADKLAGSIRMCITQCILAREAKDDALVARSQIVDEAFALLSERIQLVFEDIPLTSERVREIYQMRSGEGK